MRNLLALVVLVILASSCKEHDVVKDVPKRTIFTFTSRGDADIWIVLRDNSTGDLIESRQMPTDKTPAVFESTKPIPNNKIDVTIFTGKDDNGNSIGRVYAGIDIGANWSTQKTGPFVQSPDYGGYLGYYNLTITNVPSLFTINVSDKFGVLGVYDIGKGYNYSGKTITAYPIITANGHSQLVTIDTGSGKPKYTMVNDPTVGQNISVDFSTFKEYDRYVNFPLPAQYYNFSTSVLAYEDGFPYNHDTYVIHYYMNSNVKRSDLNFGVLNSLKNYEFMVYVDSYQFNSYGPAPTSIPFLAASDFKVSATSFSDYSIVNSAPFTFRTASFRYLRNNSTTVEFLYMAPQGYTGKHYDPVTPELVSKYGLDLSKLTYNMTSFVNGRTYDQLQKYSFDPAFDSYTPYSEASVFVYNQ